MEEVGIPKVTLYRWIKKGKAKTREGNKGIIGVDRQELEESWNYISERKAFAKALAKHQGINQGSARRWIRRHEISGLSLKEIIEEAKRRILKKWPRLGSGRWWRVTDT